MYVEDKQRGSMNRLRMLYYQNEMGILQAGECSFARRKMYIEDKQRFNEQIEDARKLRMVMV